MIEKIIEILKEADEKGFLLKVQGGLIFTPGCQNDYGCCSKSVDLSELYDLVE